MRRRTAPLIALVVGCLVSGAGAHGQGEAARPHPNAPPEVRQYEFMLGHWVGQRTDPGDAGVPSGGTIYWYGTYILDGWAVRTDWEHHFRDGTIQRGTMLRTYDPSLRQWSIAETYSLHPRLDVFSGHAEGDLMIQSSTHGTPGAQVLARRVYFDIRPDSFEDRVESSRDGGRTWTLQFRESFTRAKPSG